MRVWKYAAGVIFFTLASVYSNPAIGAAPAPAASGADNSATAVQPPPEIVPPKPSAEKPVASPKLVAGEAGTFSIQINNDTNLVEILRLIGAQAQISIIPGKDVRGTVPAMDLYNVTVPEALDAILQTNDMHWVKKGQFIFVYSKEQWDAMQKASHVQKTEIFRLHYVAALDVATLVKQVLSNDGKVSNTAAAGAGIDTGGSGGGSGGSRSGGSSSSGSTGGGSSAGTGGNAYAGDDMVVVTDYPENIETVRAIIQKVDHRPAQVLVEATILSCSLTEDNALGIDFSFLGGVNLSSVLADGLSVPAMLNGTVLGASTAAPLVHQGYAGFTTGGFDSQVPPGGLQIGLIHHDLAAFLQALESVNNTVVLANPKVLTVDKQAGEVIVGSQQGYQTTTVTQTTSTQTIQFLDSGTILSFRPFVGDDGYIRMEVHPEDSTGSISSTGLPSKVTTEVTSNILVQDGNTILIAGLFRENGQVGRAQAPFLGNLPGAGALFRNQADHTQRQEIVVLLTTHIIKDDNAYSKLSEAQLKEAEKLRVGVRRGMMFFGRERLAESEYECATTELAKANPDVNRALWHLDCAINLNPTFLEAIDLKEKLTGKIATNADNASVRDFVRKAIMAEAAMAPEHAASEASTPPAEAQAASTTQSALELQEALVPSTQAAPTPIAAAPTSQPVEPFAASQPSPAPIAAEPTCQPAEPIAAAPTSQPAEPVAASQPAPAPIAASPTSQPSGSPSNVTELPLDK